MGFRILGVLATPLPTVALTVETQLKTNRLTVYQAIDGAPTTSISNSKQAAVSSTCTITAPSRTTTIHAEAVTITTTATYVSTMPSSSSPLATTWIAPTHYSNLASFNVTKFAYGQSNVQLVSVAKMCTVDSGSNDPSPSHLDDDHSQTAIQLFYPKGSINPGGRTPQGGADFYGSPLESMRSARNVSMEYAVFFPNNFRWALGGKLPGLYGGRPGCSGGDAAEDCFSTRLMWRAKGAGELYLYAPKTKQGPGVCQTPPRSECNADYGLSIGRGSFYFQPGEWTIVRQTVGLNTPGVADGTFTLEVNGTRIMDVHGIFYREALPTTPMRIRQSSLMFRRHNVLPLAIEEVTASQVPDPEMVAAGAENNTGMGSVLNSFLSAADINAAGITETVGTEGDQVGDEMDPLKILEEPLQNDDGEFDFVEASSAIVGANVATVTIKHAATVFLPALMPDQTRTVYAAQLNSAQSSNTETTPAAAVGFVGIFFSTFFGGHEPMFASPSDQQTWFKGFSLRVNDGDRH